MCLINLLSRQTKADKYCVNLYFFLLFHNYGAIFLGYLIIQVFHLVLPITLHILTPRYGQKINSTFY